MTDVMDIDTYTSPRGMKRKADEQLAPQTAPRRIKALGADVVNKIAAGEIIVAPVHALKELIENAVDAGSTSLEIVVKEGGLKLLQITDNGHGIDKADLAILCHRHTTSKLKSFEDLSSIGTYGFRGEALASISHVAHLTVTTKTKDSTCAYRALYSACELVPSKSGGSSEPKPTAGRQGTQITVEDLFWNMPTRRRAFRSASEEYNKIVDVVGKYAIHCEGVAFSCKKLGESSTSLATQMNASTVESIRLVYGSGVANELIAFESANVRYGFKASGFASNANYHVKNHTAPFINHRLVDSTNIRKAIETTYSTFLPKGGHPFLYLNLEVEPHRVDVNVHPTKREVNFLNEDEIVEQICNDIRVELSNVDTSRTFMKQTLLSGTRVPIATISKDGATAGTPAATTASKSYENNLVRTDAKLRKITTMLLPSSRDQAASLGFASNYNEETYESFDREPIICCLQTVKELRAEVRDKMHHELTEVLAGHTFVGIVDERRRLAAIQGGVKLFLVDYGMVCAEYFYQVGLTDFGNFGAVRFQPALSLKGILRLGAEYEKLRYPNVRCPESDFDIDEVIEKVSAQLLERREMLMEYFTLEISPDGGTVEYSNSYGRLHPSLAKLPRFLLRLGPHVNWTDEKECFRTFLHELAEFYVPEQLPLGTALDSDEELKARKLYIGRVVEEKLFPAFATRLVATKHLMKGCILEVANLKGLYKVFERC